MRKHSSKKAKRATSELTLTQMGAVHSLPVAEIETPNQPSGTFMFTQLTQHSSSSNAAVQGDRFHTERHSNAKEDVSVVGVVTSPLLNVKNGKDSTSALSVAEPALTTDTGSGLPYFDT